MRDVSCHRDRKQRYILSKYGQYIQGYFRYIDDLLLLWSGSTIEAMDMVQALNQIESPIKFTSNISSTAVQFLDLEIAITNQCLSYCLYSKPTDRNTILHSTSAHPVALKRSLPKAQFLRVIQNNSDVNIMEEQLKAMMERFLERGYRRNDLVRALEEAKIAKSQGRSPKVGFSSHLS
ncbi:Hypothetical predicted protein [Pelobates cultripes]|uniref:Helix-turn-helix domain-containing protein n=1 Tax=Pelobates cultripes TaxID=61616 RepID=A0AAD1S209_PELCU|nr:Hypothetical predicted protein [Pelobates cultripes]